MSKRSIWFLALISGLVSGSAQEKLTVAVTPEAICGYGGRLVTVAAGTPRTGLSVDMLAGEIAVNQIVPLRFRVYQSPGDVPVDDLQVEHEKLMHVIGVRDDLGGFFHIHPQRSSPGLWQATLTLTNGGRYQVWSDIKRRGTVYSFAQPPLIVTGKMHSVPPTIPKLLDTKAGYQVSLVGAEALRVGKTNPIQVVVRDPHGTQVGMDFFLGALMHLVLVKDDLTVYLHGHAENHDKRQPTIFFNARFPQPGNYKLFVQFRPAKTKLSPEEALLAEFWVQVAKAD